MTQRPIKRILAMGLTLLLGALPAALLLGQAPAAAQPSGGTVNNCSNDSQLDGLIAGGGNINFNCGPSPVTITVSGWQTVTLATTIDGGGKVTLSGGNLNALFTVSPTASLTLQNITLTRGNNVSTDGGAINNRGALIIESSLLAGNSSNLRGGAIYSSGTLTMTNSTLRNNSGQTGGGGIYNDHGRLALSGSSLLSNTIQGNLFNASGGGLYNDNGQATLTSVMIISNTAGMNAGAGGGLENIGSTANLTVSQSSVSENQANAYAAGLDNSHGTVTLTDVTFDHNLQTSGEGDGGGALFNYSGHVTLNRVTLSRNIATRGGGIVNQLGTLLASNVTLSNNYASFDGGGISNDAGATLVLTNATVSQNTTFGSGGGLSNDQSAAWLTDVTFNLNSGFSGGGLYLRGLQAGETITLTDSIVANSTAGGDCNVNAGSTTSIISSNHNLASDTTCNAYFTQPNDQKHVDPKLGLLRNNGGTTLTHLPAANSPAVNQGGLICPATDQRGVVRPQGGVCDVGAVERQASDVDALYLYLPLVRR